MKNIKDIWNIYGTKLIDSSLEKQHEKYIVLKEIFLKKSSKIKFFSIKYN